MKHLLFYCLVLYYLVLNYFLAEEVQRFSFLYYALTLPALGFVVLNYKYLFRHYTQATATLVILVLIIVVISLFRLDVQTIVSGVLLFTVIIIIVNAEIHLKLKLINWFFLITVLGSVISYHIGINRYGYIPDLVNLKGIFSGGAGPRISLFPLIPESGFFSLLVILCNFYMNQSRSRYFFYLLGGYFFFLSGSRTALVIFIFFIGFELICKVSTFRPSLFYKLLNIFFLIAFIIAINLKSLLVLIGSIDNSLIQALVLRNANVSEISSNQDVSTRLWIWEQHFKIASQNPFFGIGTFKFEDFVRQEKDYQVGAGTESFITSWLARIGISIFLLLFFLWQLHLQALKSRDRFSYFLVFFFTITSLSYGSFIVPYNFMFLLMIAALQGKAGSQNGSRRFKVY